MACFNKVLYQNVYLRDNIFSKPFKEHGVYEHVCYRKPKPSASRLCCLRPCQHAAPLPGADTKI